MNETNGVLPITEDRVPSVIGIDSGSNLIVGIAAREQGLKGRTNTYHFKTALGTPQDDTQYQARVGKDGRNLKVKPKDYWCRDPKSNETVTFTPLEATKEFLRNLVPSGDGKPQQLVIGEPALGGTWRQNYRTNMRTILAELGFKEPMFFPEPFAVYQYYRNIEKAIRDTDKQQTVLVLDFGGGTFDCCVIRTTRVGELAASGAHSKPLGVQSIAVAGEAVDIELLKKFRDKARTLGHKFKESPIERARNSAQSLWLVENAKIKLSEGVGRLPKDKPTKSSSVSSELTLPGGTFHMRDDITVSLNGEELSEAVRHLWDKKWGGVLLNCHRQSSEKLGKEIEKYDVVLLAGGSAHLPFLEEHIRRTLPTQLKATNFVIGGQAGAAVAKGIAVECREQANKRPGLVNERIVSCLLNDLYVRTGRNKKETLAPKIKSKDRAFGNDKGLIYKTPGVLEGATVKTKLVLRYQPKGCFYYWFHGTLNGDDDPFNIGFDRIRLPGNKAYDRKVDLELEISDDGTIVPKFVFRIHGKSATKVEGQQFTIGGSRVEGKICVGVDFGTSNSYVASFVALEKPIEQAMYPEYEISRDTTAQLLKLEQTCKDYRDREVVSPELLQNHAKNALFEFVFHSNKIEGNQLSRGQTEGTLKAARILNPSKDEKEVINLRDAYLWVLDNCEAVTDQLSAFAREVNKKILNGIDNSAGKYRTEPVSISGVDYVPPPPGSVDDFMIELSEEIRESKTKTSGLELAVRAHTKLVAIHPFIDGNGRTARLIVTAILLSSQLPVVVLNSDDKERYLDALSKSNAGLLDSLLLFFSELLLESLSEVEELFIKKDEKAREPALKHEEKIKIDSKTQTGEPREIEVCAASKNIAKSRLSVVLRKKSQARKANQTVAYDAWSSAFQMLRNELSSCAKGLDELEEFRQAGYQLGFGTYDLVNEDRFESYWTRQNLAKTWFCSISIFSALETSGLMFQLGRCSAQMHSLESKAAPVSCTLAIGGVQSGNWVSLRDEPIKLREIGYANGHLIYMDYDGSRIDEDLSEIFDGVIADLIDD